jgi:excisionase family DNA binding protein
MTPSKKKATAYRLLADAFAMLAEAEEMAPPADGSRDELLTFATCGLESRAVRRLIERGRLPAAKIGRRIVFRKSALAAVIDELAAERPSPATPASTVPTPEEAYDALVRKVRERNARIARSHPP